MQSSQFITQGKLTYVNRDYLLVKFYFEGAVDRKQFAEEMRMSHASSRELLSQIAVLDIPSRKWKLKYPPDKEFMDSFPETLEKADKYWKSLPKTKEECEAFVVAMKEKLKAPARENVSAQVKRVEKKDFSLPTNIDERLPKQQQLDIFLKEMLKRHGVLNLNSIKISVDEYKKKKGLF